ncbi:MAG: phage tail assembly chaperone [Paucibacter sp.]|nr:phage tail assembly chaperone [Roseateles sp.]
MLEGHFDHLSQRVAVDLLGENGGPVVVPYQPPAPPDDELRTWAWDQTSKRWRSTPTTAAIAADVRAERYRRMVAADWVTLRAVRTGTPVPTVWATYLQLLADLPEQAGFPHTITWPVPPDETQGRITP